MKSRKAIRLAAALVLLVLVLLAVKVITDLI